MRPVGIFLLLFMVLPFSLSVRTVCAELAPDFTLADIDGNAFSLSGFQGRVVILDFFATWCDPCMEEIPHLKTVDDTFNESLVIISISVDPYTDSVGKLMIFRDTYNVTWIVARDVTNVYEEYGVSTIPTLFVIDQDRNVRHSHVGLTEESLLISEVELIIPELRSALFPLLVATTAVAVGLGKILGKTKKFPAERSDS